MRAALFAILAAVMTDVSPRGVSFRESRWNQDDFVVAANDPVATLVDKGETVGIKITGIGESCLLRRKAFPFRLPCRFRFRIRWTECGRGNAYPSVHLVLDPPPLDRPWWKSPITEHVGRWRDGVQNFVFHFSTDPEWKHVGLSNWPETADRRHQYSPPKDRWIDVEMRLESKRGEVFVDGLKVAEAEADLRRFRSFTYGIGDQTSTFVELDDFRCEAGG
ncbi:MAG TPA: hypothetical protein VFC86_02015 [Planctomycetota bacterium]|nr:hypothetical protein [Planctomycetota bacterium]